ncbi:MAG TPA: hypothetical protein VG755_22145, partial [Nannocystaceae bacterium]|nr:hypothetical protein [Nannocystaceae bacterium]
ICARVDGSLATLVRAIVGPAIELASVSDRWCMPRLLDPSARGWMPLRESLQALLRIAGAKLADVVLGECSYPGSPIADRLAITQETPGALTDLATLDTLRVGLLARRHTLVVHHGHPMTQEALGLAATEPELAAYLLIKAFRLGRGLDAALDTKLIEHVVGARWVTKAG